MPVTSKVFTYEVDGLSYTVTVYEEGGEFYADITVLEGAMDVNAVYFGDDDFSGDSESLNGPLNMNGAQTEDGDKVQWDSAVEISRPGLGREGEDKETYISEGDTLTLGLDIDSLDEIDVFGIRATSTSTEEGSIKAVSDDPEEPEDPEDPVDPTFEKVGFGYEMGETGFIEDGIYLGSEDLPEGVEPTFDNYVTHFVDETGGDITALDSVVFYEFDDEGNPQELFRLEAPEEGYADADELLEAYDDAIDSGVLDDAEGGDEGLQLMAALSMTAEDDGAPEEEDTSGEEEVELDLV